MYMSINDRFLSKNNQDFIYGQIQRNILNECQYNIDDNPKMHSIVLKVSQELANKSKKSDLNQLNNKVIDTCQGLIAKKHPKTEIMNRNVTAEYEKIAKSRTNDVKPVITNTQPTGFNIKNFQIDDSAINDLTGENVMYANENDLNNREKEDIGTMYEKMQQERKNALAMFGNSNLSNNLDSSGNYLENRNKGVTLGRLEDIDMTKMYSQDNINTAKIENKIIQNIDNQRYFVNSTSEQNDAYVKYLEGLRNGKDEFGKRNYVTADDYITINSADRVWQNNAENRYNFVVHFNSGDFASGAAINRSFKNVTAVELLKIIVPQDHQSIPFDQRLYIDYMSFPYISLHIDEIDGVFTGTSNSTTKAFNHLVIDKEYATDILTSEAISDNVSSTETKFRFTKQFKRGYYAMAPIYNEKKIYYNTPIAINRFTIKLLTPDGHVINTAQDTLKIANIQFEIAGDYELTNNNSGFPRTSGENIIKITTTTYFSNKSFRIGDQIRFSNYDVERSNDNNDFRLKEFINRPEGHYIINLERQIDAAMGNNYGFINTLYISPPGEIDYNTGGLKSDTYFTANPTVIDYGELINLSLQVHIMMRITTRRDETRSVFNPMNV